MKRKSIETYYNGVFYRSRLEARWAIWFALVGLRAEYECVGIQLGTDWYLPDFRLVDADVHVEIKPAAIPKREEARLARIMAAWGEGDGLGRFAVIRGQPMPGHYGLWWAFDGDVWGPCEFARCRRCDGMAYIAMAGGHVDGWGNIGPHTCGDHERPPTRCDEDMTAAFTKAARWRFDHIGATT